MVGLGTLLVAARRSGTALSWLFRRDLPKTKWFLRHRGVRRACSSVRHDGSGLGRHRGRAPTVDRAQLHEGRRRRATDEHGRVGHVPRGRSRSTRWSASRTILVLRGMSRRLARVGRRSTSPTSRTARAIPASSAATTPRGGAGRMNERDVARRAVLRGHRVRAVRRRRLRRRLLGPRRRRRRAGRTPARARSTTRSVRCGRRTTCG